MRCLILGATGQIGSHLLAACEERGLARLGTWYTRFHSQYVPLDIRDGDAVRELIADYQPDVTFHAVGLTCSGFAEAYPELCRQITIDGTRHVTEAVARQGGKLVFVSSDEVFGECLTAQREDSVTAPSNEMARCYATAEDIIRDALPEQHLIVRTSWVFGCDDRARNLGFEMLRKFRKTAPFVADTERHGHPTYAPDLADVILELTRSEQTGTVHAIGPDRHNEFTFARLAAHIFGRDAHQIRHSTDDDHPRPLNVWLDRYKLRSLLGPHAIRSAADGLRGFRDALKPTLATVRAA